jgi:5-bromo-4-chloroindolyl phosphate hydrolysis protein
VTLAIFFACLGIYSISLGRILPASAVMWAVVVSFVIGMAGAFLIYKKVLAIAQKKYNLDEKLGLGPRRPRD